MGFGLLFVGYFMTTLMSLNHFGAFFKLLGYIITLISALKLKKYNKDEFLTLMVDLNNRKELSEFLPFVS